MTILKTRIISGLLISFGVLVILVELIGRYYGLCTYPLYIESDKFEYIHAPNQSLKIYRKNFLTNSYSMRSKPVRKSKDSVSVLFIGDSVINGGNLTDNDSLGTSILENSLSKLLKQQIRTYNVSAGSWGPDNAAEYIKHNGVFDAKMFVLVVSSHDAYDNITHEKVVGNHPQFPKENALFAWSKLIERGIQFIQSKANFGGSSSKIHSPLAISEGNSFNTGFDFFSNLSDSLKTPLLVYIHPTTKEIASGALNDYGNEIISYCEQNNIPFINEMENGIRREHFRDGIHYNDKGQALLASNLENPIAEILENLN